MLHAKKLNDVDSKYPFFLFRNKDGMSVFFFSKLIRQATEMEKQK